MYIDYYIRLFKVVIQCAYVHTLSLSWILYSADIDSVYN